MSEKGSTSITAIVIVLRRQKKNLHSLVNTRYINKCNTSTRNLKV